MAGYIFGGDTGISYDALQRQRAIAEQLMRGSAQPRNAAEGLASAVSSVAGGLMSRKLDKTEAADRAKKKAELAAAVAKFGPNHELVKHLLKIPGYARGTNFHPGGLAVVGEEGPELVQLPRGAAVAPNSMMSGNGMGVPEGLAGDFEPTFDLSRPSQLMDGMAVEIAQDGPAKLTEGQSKDIGFFRRGLSANQELATPGFEEALTQYTDDFAGNFGSVGRLFQDAEYQQARRAANEFLAMTLRKDTGAQVTNEEFALYGPMYIPMPGDKPELLAAKRKAREQFLLGLESGGGSAAELYDKTREDLKPDEMDDAEYLKSLGLE